jgi:pimeloyl-ACP methyl ester carboxylesterase
LLYARLRYGPDFTRANPEDAAVHSSVPVLLIHGENDVNILPWHSVELARADSHAQLWLVPRAVHTGAWNTAPQEFETRVLGFFAEHGRNQLRFPSGGLRAASGRD